MKRILTILFLGAVLLTGCGKQVQTEPMQVIFVGTQDDADCAVFLQKGFCVLVDTGEAQDAPHILQVLAENQVQTISCLILTHPDKDHIGSAAVIAEQYSVEQVLVPDYPGDKGTYRQLLKQLGDAVEVLHQDKRLTFGDLHLTVLPPRGKTYQSANNYSLITRVEHGSVRMLLMGDAQKIRLKELSPNLLGKVDVYKVPHHGRDSTTGAKWIAALKPSYAVVTAAQAGGEIAQALKEAGSTVRYTVAEKDAAFLSDGKTIQMIP